MKSYFSERVILSLFTFFKIVTWGANGKPTELTLGQFQIMFMQKKLGEWQVVNKEIWIPLPAKKFVNKIKLFLFFARGKSFKT